MAVGSGRRNLAHRQADQHDSHDSADHQDEDVCRHGVAELHHGSRREARVTLLMVRVRYYALGAVTSSRNEDVDRPRHEPVGENARDEKQDAVPER